MSQPIALIGSSVVDVIGINPLGFSENMEANFALHRVFGADIYVQPVGGGENVETLNLACRPHVHGGLNNYLLLKELCGTRMPVPFIRMAGLVGSYSGLVVIQRISREENRIAPTGIGYRWEFNIELLYVGQNIGVGF